MAKKGRIKPKQAKKSTKWSRSNTLNYILGIFVALSMVLGSVFAFGGASSSSQATPVVTFVDQPFTPTPGGPTFTPTPLAPTMATVPTAAPTR